uniref:DEP domain containing 1B n=1 Tax=Malurus cyaneus samueli TaxID=2593467 RepID=A0A8C5TIJ5_9PASS
NDSDRGDCPNDSQQTVKLLKKFLKNHVIEDIKGRWGKEDFEDDGHLYRFPPSSPLKSYPKKPSCGKEVIKFPDWNEPKAGTSQEYIPVKSVTMNSEMWYKRHSIAIGEVPACKVVFRRELTQTNIEVIWKSMTLSRLQKVLGLDSLDEVLDTKLVNSKHIVQNVYNVNKQGIVTLEDKSKELPHWILSAMKCLANCNPSPKKSIELTGPFERDVFKTIVDYFGQIKEPLLTFHFFDVFVSVLGLLQKPSKAVEALQISCLLLPPENRKRLQLLVRMMARISLNQDLPPLSESVRTRTLVSSGMQPSTFFLADLDATLAKFIKGRFHCKPHLLNIRFIKSRRPIRCHLETQEFALQRFGGDNAVKPYIQICLLNTWGVKTTSKRFQKTYPEVYRIRFPTPETEAVLFPEKTKQKPPILMWAFKKPFQPFHRTRSFRM